MEEAEKPTSKPQQQDSRRLDVRHYSGGFSGRADSRSRRVRHKPSEPARIVTRSSAVVGQWPLDAAGQQPANGGGSRTLGAQWEQERTQLKLVWMRD